MSDTGKTIALIKALAGGMVGEVRKGLDAITIHEDLMEQEVASFSDGADNLPMKVVASVNPVQDLHGYDYPWPAGGGKNLFNKDGYESISAYIDNTPKIVESSAHTIVYFPCKEQVRYIQNGKQNGCNCIRLNVYRDSESVHGKWFC